MKKPIILLMHLSLFLLAIGLYLSKNFEYLSIFDLKEDQFARYVTHDNCPKEFGYFQYCIMSGDYVENMIIGDSSVLAAAEAKHHSNTLFLGAGSCPILPMLSVSYSTEGCDLITDKFYEYLSQVDVLNVSSIGFMHRSEYLGEVDRNIYLGALSSSINAFYSKQASAPTFVLYLEPPRLYIDPAVCYRLGESNDCKVKYSDYYEIRRDIFLNYRIPDLEVLDVSLGVFHYSDYKDKVHLTGKAYRRNAFKSLYE